MTPRYPDPTDRVAFETHAVQVKPGDMKLTAIRSELDYIYAALDGLASPDPVGWKDWARVGGGAGLTAVGFVFPPAAFLGLALIGYEGHLLNRRRLQDDQLDAARRRLRARREALTAELDRRGIP